MHLTDTDTLKHQASSNISNSTGHRSRHPGTSRSHFGKKIPAAIIIKENHCCAVSTLPSTARDINAVVMVILEYTNVTNVGPERSVPIMCMQEEDISQPHKQITNAQGTLVSILVRCILCLGEGVSKSRYLAS